MNSRVKNPALALESFTCPSCGALAHQSWFRVFAKPYEKDQKPWIPVADAVQKALEDRTIVDEDTRKVTADYFKRRLAQKPFFDSVSDVWLRLEIENIYVSRCYSCEALAIWVYDKLIYPAFIFNVEPNGDLDEDIKLDFLEAAKVLDLSPRGAAALLRLCVQKLCKQLGEAGKNIDSDIASLVAKGLEPAIQKALGAVRNLVGIR